MTKLSITSRFLLPFRHLSFVINSSFVIRASSFSLFRLQRDEAAAAVAVDAHQNLFVGL
jgi:hypothetical protein